MEGVLIIRLAARQIDTANRLLQIYWCCAGVCRFLDWWKQGKRQQEAEKRSSKD